RRAAAGNYERAGGREVGMGEPVTNTITRAIVTRGREAADAQQRGGLERLVHCCPGLGRPERFALPPADRYQRRIVHRIVNRRTDSVEEALVRVRGEVDDFFRPWRDGADDFEIE